MTELTFTTREEYLAYRAEWKANYKKLSADIRLMKNNRKKFKWEHRIKGDTISKRRTKIGENPNYDVYATWRVFDLKRTATTMLEELADKAIGQMDRLAVTSFETALGEMTDFHRFLIDAYTTNDETGKAVSFAQIGDWNALHEDWIRQYRRLFERAAEYIGRENDFIETLAHLPIRLLPG